MITEQNSITIILKDTDKYNNAVLYANLEATRIKSSWGVHCRFWNWPGCDTARLYKFSDAIVSCSAWWRNNDVPSSQTGVRGIF